MNTIFQENRIIKEYDPEYAVKAGRAAAECSKRIAIGKNTAASAVEYALVSGMISGGADVVNVGECLETEVFFASDICDCSLCLYIHDDSLMKIDIRSKGGIMITGKDKEVLERNLENNKKYINASEGNIINAESLKNAYRHNIKKMLSKDCPYSIYVNSSGNNGKRIHIPESDGEELVISLSSDGTRASLFSEKYGFVSMEELVFICCTELFENNKDAALPLEFPHSADRFASEYGCMIHRYYINPDGISDDYARKLAVQQKFTLDGLYLAIKAINIASEKNMNFKEICKSIPKFYASKKFIEFDGNRAEKILEKYNEKMTPDGAVFVKNDNRIVMQRSSSGNGLWLNTESTSMEAAAELCTGITSRLTGNVGVK